MKNTKHVLYKILFLACAVMLPVVAVITVVKSAKIITVDAMAEVNCRSSNRKIAITFDDGPHPYYTGQLLDGLKERGAVATFFVIGENVAENPDLVRRMKEEGHLIGNHTFTHLQLRDDNREEFKAELLQTNNIIRELTEQEVSYVRPPYGTWDSKLESELSMFPVLWTIDPLDWCTEDCQTVVEQVVAEAKEDAIILLHDEYKSSVTAALQIVDILQAKGYEFVTVDELLFD